MGAETLGEALRRWRNQRGFSLRQVAERVHYSHVYLWEIEKGTKDPQPDFVSRCDDLFAAGGQLVAIAARARRQDSVEDQELGLSLGSDWTECFNTVTSLWRHDAQRRKFLRGAMFVPAAVTAPVNWWLSSNIIDDPTHTVGADVEWLRRMITTFRRLDNLYGGGHIRPTVVQFLAAEVHPVLHRGSLETLGHSYLSAVAELTQLAGWFAYDSLEHGLAQRYFIQALQLARWAQDRPLGAEILNGMSHQAIFLGQPQRAADLADAAHKTAKRAHSPSLLAESAVMKARSYAMQGEERGCVRSLAEAERQMSADRTGDPQWMGYFDEAYLAAFFGHCYRALGQGEKAEQHALRSLDMDESYLRGRLFNQILLAESYVLLGHVDHACLIGQQAVDLASEVSSARAVVFINRLVQDLRPWRSHRSVKQFADQAQHVSA